MWTAASASRKRKFGLRENILASNLVSQKGQSKMAEKMDFFFIDSFAIESAFCSLAVKHMTKTS